MRLLSTAKEGIFFKCGSNATKVLA